MVFSWSLSDNKTPQVSRTPLSILADLINAVALLADLSNSVVLSLLLLLLLLAPIYSIACLGRILSTENRFYTLTVHAYYQKYLVLKK